MNSRYSRAAERAFTKEDKALQKNVFARRNLDADLEAQQSLEKIHLQTIRSEKVRLQKELERMRGRGQRMMGKRPVVGMSNNTTRLTQLRLTREPAVINGGTSRVVRAASPVPGATGDPNTARVPQEAVGRGRQILELPAINPGNRSSRSPRNGYRSNRHEMGEEYLREQQMLEHKKLMSRKQEELLARVEKFGEDIGAQKLRDGGEPATHSPTERSVKSDDAIAINADPSSSFPPPRRTNFGEVAKRGRSNSLSEYDLKHIKESITKRLVGEETAGQANDSGVAQEKQQINRTISTTSGLGNLMPRRKNHSTGSGPHPMDMVFDQETYAPDGSLRTMHMLPDPKDSFEEAKKARYLRWRGPHEEEVELTVNEIFGKSEGVVSRKYSTSAPTEGETGT
ncbi:uncharacterized protein LOC110988132 [Acanthaster planci]|uniref:Uncharacterized protein LOC110988132 n=1 Tax=Acanthaster planci TaxID=133434 RepID=A0A8B7ZNT2_ACAPL|nr:uncharacterized protein LOC110988132 [Acanthaster planci]XP_022107083.1 uncharacterized protein LOC110988132 [Acanthaster planci]XP_022107084.1 uncharacterized protein LOC110988132 [Acanthaster planci]